MKKVWEASKRAQTRLWRWSKEANLAALIKGARERERENAEEKIFVDSENIISKLVVCYKHIHNCAVNKGKSSDEKRPKDDHGVPYFKINVNAKIHKVKWMAMAANIPCASVSLSLATQPREFYDGKRKVERANWYCDKCVCVVSYSLDKS